MISRSNALSICPPTICRQLSIRCSTLERHFVAATLPCTHNHSTVHPVTIHWPLSVRERRACVANMLIGRNRVTRRISMRYVRGPLVTYVYPVYTHTSILHPRCRVINV